MKEKFLSEADLNEITAIRHDIHKHPEIGFQEERTSKIVETYLKKLPNIKVHTGLGGGTGIVATLSPKQKSDNEKSIALRADMDALPITEETGLPYASVNNGVMHACGHDGHTAALLGAAKWLANNTDKLKRNVILVFQPAEEGLGGAKMMCKEGVIEKFNIGEIYAAHNWPGIELGKVAVCKRETLASADWLEIEIVGKGCHGASPHHGIDPIVATCSLINNLNTINSRFINSLSPIVLTFGTINGGTAKNIIANSVKITGSLRTYSDEIREKAISLINQITENTARSFGAEAKINTTSGDPALINTEKESNLVVKKATELFSSNEVIPNHPPYMASEDFSNFLTKVPGTYWFIGNGDSEVLHHPKFNFNDINLDRIAQLHCAIATS